MKSYVQEFGRVYGCLFQDFAYAYPNLRAEFERDLIRLNDFVESRGLPAMLVDLPAIGKHLDRCLSNGQYISSGLPLTQRVSRKVAVPKFLRGLYLLIFDEVGRLRDDCDVTAVAFLRQVYNLAKKAKVACSDDKVQQEMRDFIAVDTSLPEPHSFWDTGDLRLIAGPQRFQERGGLYAVTRGEGPENPLFDLTVNLDKVVQLICQALGDYTPSDWSFRHGPGVVSERVGQFHKYQFVNWSDMLDRVYPYADTAFHSYASWADSGFLATSFPGCSRMISVPKTFSRPRLIAAEPTEHQFCQQNIWHYFASRVGKSWLGGFLTFHSQELNQQLCLKASEDGRLCTIDLSSASDRVTCQVVQSFFWRQPALLEALCATRTRFVSIPLSDGALTLKLRKFSTMGSACTFPVESVIFLGVALAAVLTQHRLPVTLGNVQSLIGQVGVFGDDIIIPSDTRDLMQKALEHLSFKVNVDKSFSVGKFRESCGVDAFRGERVTPVYLNGLCNGKPESVASTVATANNFLLGGYLCTARYLASTVPRRFQAWVSADSGVFGLKSFSRPAPNFYKKRWNTGLQRLEVYLPQISIKGGRTATNDDAGLLQFFTEDPSPTTSWMHGIAQRPQTRIRMRWVAYTDVQPKTPV